jgi:hypothetical protein
MLSVLGDVIPLALAGAISPLVLLAALVILGNEQRPRLRCGAFVLGYVTMTALLFAAGYLLLGLDLSGTSGHHGLLSSKAAQIGMSLVLLLTAVWFLWKAPSEATQQRWLARINSPRIPLIAYFAIGLIVLWFSASFIVVAAILHRLSVAGLALSENVIVLIVAVVITALPALVPWGVALIAGDRHQSTFQRLGNWMFRNGRFILAALFVVLGLQNLLHALGS